MTRTAGDLVGMEVTITREFDAPRELVFEAWTDPRHVAQWFGPKTFTNPVCEVDARPGGKLLIHMRAPDGGIYPTGGTFEVIVPYERIVLTTTAFEEHPDGPKLAARHTVSFEDNGGGTTMRFHSIVIRATPEMAGALSGMEQGWSESFDKLAAYLTAVET